MIKACLLALWLAMALAGAAHGAAMPALTPACPLYDPSGALLNPQPVRAVQEELKQKTGLTLWLVLIPHLSGNMDVAASKLLTSLETPSADLLLLVELNTRNIGLAAGPLSRLSQRQLDQLQKTVIIPRLRDDGLQAGLVAAAKALAHLAAGDMGASLSFANVEKTRQPWWQRTPLEPGHLWLPGVLLLWYIIVKARKHRKKKHG